ncbi:TonB-dependent siderophore receptor [Parvibaculum sp.]|uniref:TonB-dependent receptor plug domain-containing protein n=1 Tax=Parvibaculum sp. TaxID=2024848 RepID=UPI0027377332|nr:TonB-dependent receptor [Parvibaculum sp.]
MLVVPSYADVSIAADDSKADTDETLILSPLLVNAGPIESSAQRAAQIKASAPNAIEVIDGQQLQQFNEQSLGDALRRVPSITFDGANRAREIRLRGLPGEYTQVLVNGRPLIDGESRRNFEVDRIPTGLVERVEVIRSPRAGQDGAGAAGTINIVLKSGAELPPETQVTLGGGYLEDNGNQGEITVSSTGSVGRLSYTLAGSAQQFRRNESKFVTNYDGAGAPTGAADGVNERRFEQTNLIPAFLADLEDAGRVSFKPFYLWTKEYRDDIGTPYNADLVTPGRVTDEDRERVRETYGFNAGWEFDLDDASQLALGLDWQKGKTDTARDEIRYNTNGTINRTRQRGERIDMRSVRPEMVLSLDRGAHDLSFGAGARLQKHEENNWEITNGVLQAPRADRIFEIEEDIVFTFAEDVWQAASDLTVTGGIRMEQSKTATTDFFGATTSGRETFALPSLNVVYEVVDKTDLRVGVARTLRRPDLRKLSPAVETRAGTAADPDVQGNPDQAPESIWGADAGIDHYFADDRGSVSLNFFGRLFTDKIENVTTFGGGRFVSTPQNVGDGRAGGIELSARLPLGFAGFDDFTLWGNGVFTKTSVDEPGGGSRPFLDQPDAVGNIGLDYAFTPLRTVIGVALNHTVSVDQTQSLASGGRLEQSIGSRTRLDLSSRTEITPNAILTLSATNLLGETEKRVDQQFDAGGAPVSSAQTTEETYRGFFARLTWVF